MNSATLFELIALALTLFSAAILLWPLLRPKAKFINIENAEKVIAKERYDELKAQLASGEIIEADFNSAKAELAAQLQNTQPTTGARISTSWLAVVFVVLALPAMALFTYIKVGDYASLETAPQVTEQQPVSLEQIESMVKGLAKRLEENPDDADGWIMLGRSYGVMQQPLASADAYMKAMQLLGDDAPIGLILDAVTAMQAAEKPEPAADLIAIALAKDPDNPKVRWFAAMESIRQNDLAIAIMHLEEFLKANPPDNVKSVVNKQIERLKQELNQE